MSFGGITNFSHNFAEFGGAIYTYDGYYNVVLAFTGDNNFINNSAFVGGVIYARGGGFNSPGNIVLTFNGINNFISNVAHYTGGESSRVVQFMQKSIPSLVSVVLVILFITQRNLVVQLTWETMLCLPSMEPTTSSITWQYTSMVVQSEHYTRP